MPAMVEVKFADAADVLGEAVAADAQIARKFGATPRAAFQIEERLKRWRDVAGGWT